jgi:tRNA(adenine34) deaminase
MNGIHKSYMEKAFSLAEKALKNGEIPIGAIIVHNSKIIGRGYNQTELLKDPTAHAEIIAITAAANTLEDWRLNDSILYVTKEPCAMCAGAIINSRLKQVVFGCYDEQKGCCGSLYQMCGDRRLGKPIAVIGGLMENECADILSNFFMKKRNEL